MAANKRAHGSEARGAVVLLRQGFGEHGIRTDLVDCSTKCYPLFIMSIFQRIIEPELMDDAEQVAAYASMDFSESHNRLISQIGELFPGYSFEGAVLNLGCGSGDDAFRFARAFPRSSQVAVDGSSAMIDRAKSDLGQYHSDLADRIQFITAYIPSDSISSEKYVGVISNSLLHHMHRPEKFWKCVAAHSESNTPIFIADLRRPVSLLDVQLIVSKYADGAPDILRQDFHNSLCASFTEQEIREQLVNAGLAALQVRPIGDRHIVIYGVKG